MRSVTSSTIGDQLINKLLEDEWHRQVHPQDDLGHGLGQCLRR